MLFPHTVTESRALFYKAFQAHRLKQPLSALETQIVAVILDHPEYHSLLEQSPESPLVFTPEQGLSNPFLHMGLHLAIRDQVTLDKPTGMAALFHRLKNQSNRLTAEHQIMDELAVLLWEAQSRQSPPNESLYMDRLYRLL